MVFGCVCDSSWSVGLTAGATQQAEWFGADCSRRKCVLPVARLHGFDCSKVLKTCATAHPCSHICVVRLTGHCPSGDDPRTDEDETDCEDKYNNGATTLLFANGGGAANNLCQVDCSNRGAQQQAVLNIENAFE